MWKKIPGFEFHEVNEKGQIRTLAHSVNCKNGKRVMAERLMKAQTDKNGHMYCNIKENGCKKKVWIHRAVAMAFVDNPNNKPCVNHIDNNPQNNDATNLEWCTYQENTDWMVAQGRNKRTEEWLGNLNNSLDRIRKSIVATNIETKQILKFKGVNETSKHGFTPSSVSECCRGIRLTHRGYTWRYTDE